MKSLITHLIKNNLQEIVSRSLLNCHCMGLHSIMLLESPGKTIRLYISEPGGDMYKNSPRHHDKGKGMSLAFHPHHCNLTLECVTGTIMNWEMKVVPTGRFKIDRFLYTSGITEGEMGFKKDGEDVLQTKKKTYLKWGQTVSMPAEAIHTVACAEDTLCAWLVYEGEENPDYIPYCWSNSNLEESTQKGLYIQPSEAQVKKLLKSVNLL